MSFLPGHKILFRRAKKTYAHNITVCGSLCTSNFFILLKTYPMQMSIYINQMTISELKTAIKFRKNQKAFCTDAILVELIKVMKILEYRSWYKFLMKLLHLRSFLIFLNSWIILLFKTAFDLKLKANLFNFKHWQDLHYEKSLRKYGHSAQKSENLENHLWEFSRPNKVR